LKKGIKMKITVVKEFSFEAAHYLPGYDGPCERLHGHSYRLLIGVSGKIDPISGMVMDFSKLKNEVNFHIIPLLDHSCLNDIQSHSFPREMPTAEKMVVWIWNQLHVILESPSKLNSIRMYETASSYAEWRLEQ